MRSYCLWFNATYTKDWRCMVHQENNEYISWKCLIGRSNRFFWKNIQKNADIFYFQNEESKRLHVFWKISLIFDSILYWAVFKMVWHLSFKFKIDKRRVRSLVRQLSMPNSFIYFKFKFITFYSTFNNTWIVIIVVQLVSTSNFLCWMNFKQANCFNLMKSK